MADYSISGTEGVTLTAGQALRDDYLDALAKMQLPAIVGVYGQSASGKSTTINTLQEIGIEPSRRFVTRISGTTGDFFEVPWIAASEESQLSATGGETPPKLLDDNQRSFDSSLKRSNVFNPVLFAIFNYGTYYGTNADELAKILKEPDRKAISVLMGKLVDLPNFSEAVSNLFPLLPRVQFRLMVEPYQLLARLAKRVRDDHGRAGEAHARIELLMQKYVEDQSQISPYSHLYRLVLINAVLSGEANGVAPINRGASVVEVVQTELDRLILEEKLISADLAKEVKRPRSLCYTPEALSIAIERVLPRYLINSSSGKPKCNVYMTGPLAMLPYLERIDAATTAAIFNECNSVEFLYVNFASELSNGHRWTDIEEFGGDNNIVVKVQSRKIVSVLEQSLGFEFFCDHADQILAREVTLDSLGGLYIVPPEHLIVEGCVGIGLNSKESRFLDGLVHLLASQVMDVNLIHRLIFMQDYDPSIDEGFAKFIKSLDPGSSQSLEQFIASFLCDSESLLRNLPGHLREREIDFRKIHPQPLDNSRKGTLSCSCVKRAIMMAGIIDAISKLKVRAVEMESFLSDKQLLASFEERVCKLDLALRVFLDNQIGRGDIFVKRSRPGMQDDFFSRFPVS